MDQLTRSSVITGSDLPPPASLETEGGGGDDWRLLMIAKNSMIAHLVRGRLMAEGVEVFLDTSNPSLGAFLKPFGDPLAPVKIFVKASSYERASVVLYEADHEVDLGTQTPDRGLSAVGWVMLASVGVILGVVVLVLLEIFGFAPCLLRLFCI